jgi:anaerobic magnesium-protoporphyrin IX monomethyl ester cyclase
MRAPENPKRLNTLLVSPPYQRFTSDFQVSAHHFPLGLGYIASALELAEYPVEIYDADLYTKPMYNQVISQTRIAAFRAEHLNSISNSEHEIWIEVESVIRDKKPDIVGITCKSNTLKSACMVAQVVKRVDKDITVIIGGPGVLAALKDVVQNEAIDFVVRLEGERTMVELLEALHSSEPDFHLIDGISFRNGDKIVHTKDRPLIENIDSIPFPARHLVLGAEKLPDILFKAIQGDIMTSRGCPYSCTFCSANIAWGGRSVRMRSAENVVKEIIQQKEQYGVKSFTFWDDLFTSNKKRVVDICNMLIELKASINWVCFIRVNNIDRELIALMKKAGCVRVDVGLESGSDRVLKIMQKGITVKQIHKAAEILNEIGLRWTALLMMGLPGETKEEMIATMDLLKLNPSEVVLSVFSPYPGSVLYAKLEAEGKLRDDDALTGNHYYGGVLPADEFREIVFKHSMIVDEYNTKSRFGHKDPPARRLIKISEPLEGQIDFDVHKIEVAHWGFEYYQKRVVLWIGEGNNEGLRGVLRTRKRCNVTIKLTVTPGPGRADGERTLGLTIRDEPEMRGQFSQRCTLSFNIKLQPGDNTFSLVCHDKATMLEQPNDDKRALMVLLHEMSVEPNMHVGVMSKLRKRMLSWFFKG